MCPGTLTTIQAVAVYFATLALWAYGKAHLQFAWELQNLHACIQAGRSGVGCRSFGIHTDSVALKAYCAKSMLYTATIGAATDDPSIIWLDGADGARTQMFREHNQGVPSVRISPRLDSRESVPLCELEQHIDGQRQRDDGCESWRRTRHGFLQCNGAYSTWQHR